MKTNPKNERLKYEYTNYCKEARGYATKTIDAILQALKKYDAYTQNFDYDKFTIHLAKDFKDNLRRQNLSHSSLSHNLKHLQAFLIWLSMKNDYKNKINYADIQYLNLSKHENEIAKSSNPIKSFPTLDEIKLVINAMPFDTALEKRNKALISFTILSGMRDGAITGLKLESIDLKKKIIHQNPKNNINTKFRKNLITTFFPIGEAIEQVFVEYYEFLIKSGYENHHPLFPSTAHTYQNNQFQANTLSKTHWKTEHSIRKIFKTAFQNVGLKYHSPHKFRDTLASLGRSLSLAEFEAWSRNLGHENIATTIINYGKSDREEMMEMVKNVEL